MASEDAFVAQDAVARVLLLVEECLECVESLRGGGGVTVNLVHQPTTLIRVVLHLRINYNVNIYFQFLQYII